MKSIFRILFASFIISLLLSSCSSSPNKVNYYENDILPLQIGNSWGYIDSTFESEGIKVEQVHAKITALSSIDLYGKSYKYFTLTEYNQQNKQLGRRFLSNEADGLYNYGSKNEPQNMSFRHIYLKYPVEQNSSWSAILHYFNDVVYHFRDDTVSAKCIAKTEFITVPAGTYNCTKYQFLLENDNMIEEYWKVGVGLIASNFYYKDQLLRKRVLKSESLMSSN